MLQRSNPILSPSISRLFFNSSSRSLSTLPPALNISPPDDLVMVVGNAHSRMAILNRPSVLNALNTTIGARLIRLYKSWEEDCNVGFVMVKGAGKAFCAGGDIVSLYQFLNQGRKEDCKLFFQMVYTFIYYLGTYVKPHVALLNGVTMGGGAGISIPGTFRLATDKTVFATPETLIGFHPDAGASFYLPRLPGHLGEYLGLTGARLNGAEMIACGLASHYSQIARLPQIEDHLGKLDTDDPSVIETALENFCDIPHLDQTSVMHRIDTVDKCFGKDTVEEIIDSLESESSSTKDAWCSSTLAGLKEASPLSLKVSLRSIREGRYQTFDQCLEREYHMSLQGMSESITTDFQEGVRARMVDKDMTPKWNPPSLEQVSNNIVDQYFSPIESQSLHLPTKSHRNS